MPKRSAIMGMAITASPNPKHDAKSDVAVMSSSRPGKIPPVRGSVASCGDQERLVTESMKDPSAIKSLGSVSRIIDGRAARKGSARAGSGTWIPTCIEGRCRARDLDHLGGADEIAFSSQSTQTLTDKPDSLSIKHLSHDPELRPAPLLGIAILVA